MSLKSEYLNKKSFKKIASPCVLSKSHLLKIYKYSKYPFDLYNMEERIKETLTSKKDIYSS